MPMPWFFLSGLVVFHASNSQGMGWPRVHKRFCLYLRRRKTARAVETQKVAMFYPAASDQGLYRRYGYHGAFQRQIDAGIFGYCGINEVETHIFPDVDANKGARVKHLAHTQKSAL
jgi:putative NADPH-quinone reductase